MAKKLVYWKQLDNGKFVIVDKNGRHLTTEQGFKNTVIELAKVNHRWELKGEL